jgi:predicted 3-demethylubiquinone-9 3-methyltransferase (glyoxalase superfamily)
MERRTVTLLVVCAVVAIFSVQVQATESESEMHLRRSLAEVSAEVDRVAEHMTEQEREEFVGWVKDKYNKHVKGHVTDLKKHAKAFWNEGKAAVKQTLTETMSEGKEAVKEGFAQGKEALKEALEEGKKGVHEGIAAGKEALKEGFNEAKEAVQSSFAWMKDKFSTRMEARKLARRLAKCMMEQMEDENCVLAIQALEKLQIEGEEDDAISKLAKKAQAGMDHVAKKGAEFAQKTEQAIDSIKTKHHQQQQQKSDANPDAGATLPSNN